jgi:hypothetical protein
MATAVALALSVDVSADLEELGLREPSAATARSNASGSSSAHARPSLEQAASVEEASRRGQGQSQRAEDLVSVLRGIRTAVAATDPRPERRIGEPLACLGAKARVAKPKALTGTMLSVCVKSVYGSGYEAMDPRLGPEHFVAMLEQQDEAREGRVALPVQHTVFGLPRSKLRRR